MPQLEMLLRMQLKYWNTFLKEATPNWFGVRFPYYRYLCDILEEVDNWKTQDVDK